jgi:hypothetical protein
MQHLRDLLDREIETLAIQTNTVISGNTAAASEWAFRFQTFGEAKLSEMLGAAKDLGHDDTEPPALAFISVDDAWMSASRRDWVEKTTLSSMRSNGTTRLAAKRISMTNQTFLVDQNG